MSDTMSGAASGAALGTKLGGPGWGTAIGAVVGAAGGYLGGKRKKRAQGMRTQGMQDAMAALKVDTKEERGLDRTSTREGMDWYKSNVIDTKEGKAAYAKMKDDPTMQDILKRRKQQSEEGISAERRQAMRNLSQRSDEQASAQLGFSAGQSMTNMKGLDKQNLLLGLAQKRQGSVANREQQMFLANEQARDRGLDSYQSTYTAQRLHDQEQDKAILGSMFTYGTSEAQRMSTGRNMQRQTEAKMVLEQALARAEEEAGGGFLGMF